MGFAATWEDGVLGEYTASLGVIPDVDRHLIVHELPAAPSFVGRQAELGTLRQFWQQSAGVLSVVGIGGAGKTAVLRAFLDELFEEGTDARVLVWSFYDDPDTNAFLRTCVEFVTGQSARHASGTGWFYALKQGLESSVRYLFVLDGLERVQRPVTDARGIFGQLEDPLLRGFLLRMAGPDSRSQAIITSRFPIADLESRSAKFYQVIDIDQLDVATARHILEMNGVRGEEAELDRLIESVGSHALTLDLFAAAANRYCNGDPTVLADSVMEGANSDQGQSSRLVVALVLIQSLMETREVDLLNRLCVFRFGITGSDLYSVFLREPSAAGSLAGIEIEDMALPLKTLTDLHLAHCETSGKYTIHPAVRDHFYRLFRDAAGTHGAMTEHLLSLTGRPGVGLPTSKQALDLLEELLHHALKARRVEDAMDIYSTRLGGNQHLNVTLGDYSRTYRVLGAFDECPDQGALYHCLRAFGNYEDALKSRPQNRYILIAQGRLTELLNDPHEITRTVVRFLQGERVTLPDRLADFPLSAAHLHLLKGDVAGAESCVTKEIKVCLFQDDLIRSHLALGEIKRMRNQLDKADELLDSAGQWSLSSGSHEHLCHTFLLRGRIAIDRSDLVQAVLSLEEGRQIASESGFHFFEVQILTELARCAALRADRSGARQLAETAAKMASAWEMRFVWAEAAALKVLVEVSHDDPLMTLKTLRRILEIQHVVNDMAFAKTERAIKQVEQAS